MLVLRSLLFNVAFYVNTILLLIGLIPLLVFPRKVFLRGVQTWGRSSIWLLRVLAGTRLEFRGLDKIPPGGLLVASKHQSIAETFALLTVFDDPAFVLKRELQWIPFFGWYTMKAAQVPINRSAGSAALADMNERARREAARGRQIIIFPEGTRRPAGAPPAYKYGIAHLYQNLGVPCLPVALNTGLCWPRRSFLRRPGTMVIEFLDPIPPGLPRDAFFEEVKAAVEAACARLLAEGLRDLGLEAPEPREAGAGGGSG
ncbi:MAG TPA: 1-acyl-sn-glycerol-3-phosphate acyltransferase [Beijerinckiaceae bacterium]|jgi:1-acyl-sn-glycerol-3-phosphate acyltransferase